MTPAQLAQVAEWERLASEATEGPWAIHSWTDEEWPDRIVREGTTDAVIGAPHGEPLSISERNAAFVCAARTAVPEMARMLREREAEHAEERRFLLTALGERIGHIPASMMLASWMRERAQALVQREVTK